MAVAMDGLERRAAPIRAPNDKWCVLQRKSATLADRKGEKMTDKVLQRVADGLLRAMKAEHEGQHFYMMAAQTTKDPKGQEIFRDLAREEQEHARYLREQYRSILETGEPNQKIKLGSPGVLGGAHPIFSDEILSRLEDAHFEMTALAVGIQLELDAKKYYEEQARASENIILQTMYHELAEWEASHYRALLQQHDSLKEDYWTKSGFAPF